MFWGKRVSVKIAVLAAFAFIIVASPCRSEVPSPLLPLNHWAYPVLDLLSGRGLVDSFLSGTRPLTRAEAARLVDEANRAITTAAEPPAVIQQLDRLRAEFAGELVELHGEAAEATPYFKPLRTAAFSFRYFDATADGTSTLDVNANGRNLPPDGSALLSLSGEARFGWVLTEWRPQFEFAGDDSEDTMTDSSLAEGRAALQLGPIELSVGRQALWWGQGRHGSLLLTNNARPLDMLRLTNPYPAQMPWIFGVLGPVRFDLFWSRLEEWQSVQGDGRVVSEPYLAGLRLDFKPLPWFELGAARTVMFGGKGMPKVEAEEFVTILGGRNLSGGADTSNSLAAVDGRLRLPWLFGSELYGEFGGEDEAGHFFSKTAWLAGIGLTRLEPSGRLTMSVERADFTTYPGWYQHGIYASGYTYRGKVLGHHVGGGGKDLRVAAEMQLPAALELGVAWDMEKRGSNLPQPEEHQQWFLSGGWHPNAFFSMRAFYARDQIEHAGFVPGRSVREQLLAMEFNGRW